MGSTYQDNIFNAALKLCSRRRGGFNAWCNGRQSALIWVINDDTELIALHQKIQLVHEKIVNGEGINGC
jgi:hypothetical protein